MLHALITHQWITLHGLIVVLGLAIYAIGSHTLHQRRHPSAALAWVISLVLLPYAALPLYLMFGNRKVVRRRGKHSTPWMGPSVAVPFDQFHLHQDGRQAFDALMAVMGAAQQSLDVCTFLIGRDATGDAIINQLIHRAGRGVRVRLLIDGVGIYMGGRLSLSQLRDAGVEVSLFVPPLASALRGRTNLRNHRKMAIADGQWMWCGGRNLAAEYFEGTPSATGATTPWTDLTFDLRGELVQQGQQQFNEDWSFAQTGKVSRAAQPWNPVILARGNGARLVASGPDQADDNIYNLLVSNCFTANTRILAVTPYFVPDATLLLALTLAAQRGVAVDLLLPARSNHRLADMARNVALRELAAAGGRIWLTPGMIHAKAVIFDDTMALAGSANLDGRSLFLNYEMMVAFGEPVVVRDFARWITTQKQGATPYTPRDPGLLRELLEGLVRWVAFQL